MVCYKSSILLLLFIAQFQFDTLTAAAINVRENCHELTNTSVVECKKTQDDIELVYSSTPSTSPSNELSPTMRIRIKPNQDVEIRCFRNDSFDLDKIPVMSIGSSPTLRITDCSLSAEVPVRSVIGRLGMTKVMSLHLENPEFSETPLRHLLHGLSDLMRLTIVRNRPTALPEDIFADLQNLKWLTLRLSETSLSEELFLSLENLVFLEITNSGLTGLSPRVFRKQHKLLHLDLHGNDLTNLTWETFADIPLIQELDLRENNIRTLHPNIFSSLKNLSTINLSQNHFESLPPELLAENKRLTHFTLDHSIVQSLKKLPSKFLANLPNLQHVRLSGLTTIPADIFVHSTVIQNISIVANSLEELPSELFADQVKLTNLDLSNNQLVSLPGDIFQNTKNLNVLRLSHNELENIPAGVFDGLDNLEFLYLNDNKLRTIDPQLFAKTEYLKFIYLENNQIEELDYKYEISLNPFEQLSDLRVLNLRNNSIKSILRNWRLSNVNLDILDLSHNNITELTDFDLQFVSQRIMINLTHNPIRTIRFENIAYMDPVSADQRIDVELKHNPIVCDCELKSFVQFLHGQVGQQMQDTIQVAIEDLQCSGPTELQGRLVSSLSTEELVCPVDHTSRKYCPEKCSCYIRLRDSTLIVNCTNAGLTEIPSLPVLEKLFLNATELHIENNQISRLPVSSTPGYADVTKLYASNNSLSNITSECLSTSLHLLDVSSNKLSSLDDHVLEAFSNNHYLKSLSLSNNNWLCDCSSLNLIHFVQKNSRIIQDLGKMQCENGQLFQNITLKDSCPGGN